MTQVDQVISGLLTGTVTASVADGGVEDAIAAVGAAEEAAASWAATASRARRRFSGRRSS